ncbi:ABC transporter substrate-binding protein [Haloarchaeobius sp. HRN-SO-5]|uniref:ABC transporter substrate-binding protein n=1 Tax=Haloarchaeobius sp. HRN-SO-5 TaxID=3446118 RepID=UPI003EBB0D00
MAMAGATGKSSNAEASKSRRSRRRFLQVAGAAGALGFAGCVQQRNGGTTSGGGGDGTTQGTAGGGGDIGTVTFGILNPVSGPHSPLGSAQRQAARIAVDYVNNSDDFDFEIDAVYEDTKTDPATGRQKAQKLVEQDGAQVLAGDTNSSVALAVADYANNSEVLYTSGGAAMALTGENCNRYTFRNETNTAQQAAGLVDYAVNNLGKKMWIHTADYAYGNSAIQQIRSRIEAENFSDVEVVGTTKPEQGASNFGPQISQIANSDAEVLAIPLTGGDLINFMKQAESQGLHDQVEIIGTALFAQVIRGALGSAAYGTYSSTLYNHKLETGDNAQFVQAYQDEYGSPPGSFARVGYEAVRMAARGIQMAGTADPTEVANTLPDKTMTTVLGDTHFRACDHQSVNPVWTGKINEPDSGDVGTVELLNEIPGEEAIPPCDAVNCNM